MKTSVKIGILLIVVMLFGITYANLALKKQYDVIDKNDYFWNYTYHEKLSFSKISIEGGNQVHVMIRNQINQTGIAYNDDLKDLVSYKVVNDTLKIAFDKNLVERATGNVKRLKHRIGISYNDLDALYMIDGWGSLKMDAINGLKLNLKGESSLQIDSPSKKLNVFDITLEDGSMLNFKNSKSIIDVGLLKAKILDSASVNLQTIYPEKIQLALDKRAEVTLKGKSWDALRKELSAEKFTPKTMPSTQE